MFTGHVSGKDIRMEQGKGGGHTPEAVPSLMQIGQSDIMGRVLVENTNRETCTTMGVTSRPKGVRFEQFYGGKGKGGVVNSQVDFAAKFNPGPSKDKDFKTGRAVGEDEERLFIVKRGGGGQGI